MTHHPADETLHRLVDGELSPLQATPVEAHVLACAQCGAVVDGLERLRRAARRLPREVEPPAELWTTLRDELPRVTQEANVPHAAPVAGADATPARRSLVPRPVWLLAAAAVLVIVGGIATTRLGDDLGAPGGATRGQAVPEPPPSDPLVALQGSRRFFSRETLAAVESDVRALDAAIATTERALAADPDNVHLEAMLLRAREQRTAFVHGTLSIAEGM